MSNHEHNFEVIQAGEGLQKPGLVKAWIRGVPFEPQAREQVLNISRMPFIHKHVAIMPDVHLGMGATVGSVIPTKGAIIPAAVGVDIGCGMVAIRTSLTANDIPSSTAHIRAAIERAIPHGRTDNGGANDKGSWMGKIPPNVAQAWNDSLKPGFDRLVAAHPKVFERVNSVNHLCSLGTGNHFCEMCLDESNNVWIMLHSGSRGIGNKVGSHFIELAKRDMERWFIHLPDKDLAYIPEGSEHFSEYCTAVEWAQQFAMINRGLMLSNVIEALGTIRDLPPFQASLEAVNCHHNYISREAHFGENVWVTRKGAVRARLGDMGIIPGSMGAKSFIVRGKGNPESFCSCSHGAGRRMSRSEANRTFTIEDHIKATEGVECRKDADVIDETPASYKSIDDVMEAQKDLVEVVHTLKQFLCVKG